MPHAVPALFQFKAAPVVLQLVIDGFRSVRVGSIHDRVCEPLQLRRRQDDGILGEQLLRRLDRCWVEGGAGESVHSPFHNLHLLRTHHTVALQRRQLRQQRFQCFAEHRSPRSERRRSVDTGRGLAVGELQHPHQELDHGRGAILPR